jgi:hypothetical protein
MGVIARVHHTASHFRAATEPALAASLAEAGVALFGVTDLAQGGVALPTNQTDLCRRQLEGDIVPFLGHDLGTSPCRADHLSTTTGVELNVMDAGAKWNGGEGEGVADLNRAIRAGDDCLADSNASRGQNIAFFTVAVIKQREASIAMGVVMNGCDTGLNTVLIAAKIHQTIEALMSTTTMAASDDAAIVATLAAMFGDNKATLATATSDFTEVSDH